MVQRSGLRRLRVALHLADELIAMEATVVDRTLLLRPHHQIDGEPEEPHLVVDQIRTVLPPQRQALSSKEVGTTATSTQDEAQFRLDTPIEAATPYAHSVLVS